MPSPRAALRARGADRKLARLLLGWLVWLVFATLACSKAQQAELRTPASPALLLGAPADYIPAAGLRWLLLLEAEKLARDPDLMLALQPIVPESHLQRFEQASGFALRGVERLAIAGFDYGTLYVVQTQGDNALTQARFVERLRHDPIIKRPHPRLTTVTGMAGGSPQRLVRLHDHMVAVAVGDPSLGRVVEAFALRRLSRSPTALRGVAFSGLPPEALTAPLVFAAPGPFTQGWQAGMDGLLSSTRAFAASAQVTSGRLELTAYLMGQFASDPTAVTRLQHRWQSLAESPLGSLLGLNEPITLPNVRAREGWLQLDVELRAAALGAGLYSAVAAEASELARPFDAKSARP